MENQAQQKTLVKLHPEIKDISFKHKFLIQQVFKNSILGNLGIDYFSLIIIDPSEILSLYSSEPALEFNLIDTNLWLHDGIFELNNHKDGTFIFWDELYAHTLKNTLKTEKEIKFGFSFGFFIMKRVNDLFVIYSFATKKKNHKALYQQSKDDLTKIGDYIFFKLESVHRQYIIPQIKNTCLTRLSDKIKLVVDNSKKEYI